MLYLRPTPARGVWWLAEPHAELWKSLDTVVTGMIHALVAGSGASGFLPIRTPHLPAGRLLSGATEGQPPVCMPACHCAELTLDLCGLGVEPLWKARRVVVFPADVDPWQTFCLECTRSYTITSRPGLVSCDCLMERMVGSEFRCLT